ncbi:MAG: FkbM family methyltransferase [Flavobacterium sp.]|nr:MAG: FkbM family methyltransferase [Flavobacterium sp.]
MKNLSKLFQLIPKFKGKTTVSNFILRLLNNKRDIIITIKNRLLIKIPNLIEPVGSHLFINGEYEVDEIEFIKNEIRQKKLKTFLDIGANIGLFSLSVAKEFGELKIFSIEASPRVYRYLIDNIELNSILNITTLQLGLSNNDNQEINFYSDETKFGTGSFAPVFTTKAEKVKCAKLDTLILNTLIKEQIDIIKIDVEGFELQVFQGGKHLLEKENAPIILFEFVDWAEKNAGNLTGSAQEYLISLEYQLYQLNNRKLVRIDAPLTNGSASLIAMKNNPGKY